MIEVFLDLFFKEQMSLFVLRLISLYSQNFNQVQ